MRRLDHPRARPDQCRIGDRWPMARGDCRLFLVGAVDGAADRSIVGRLEHRVAGL